MQRILHEKYEGKWYPLEPETGKTHILWMIEEIGEAIAIIKKRGEADIMDDPAVRSAFVEELADVYMYFNDVFLCYDISPEEISEAYAAKHIKNMQRDFTTEHSSYLK